MFVSSNLRFSISRALECLRTLFRSDGCRHSICFIALALRKDRIFPILPTFKDSLEHISKAATFFAAALLLDDDAEAAALIFSNNYS